MTYLIHEPNMCWVWGFCDSSLKPKGLIVVPYVAHSNLFTYSRAWNKREHKISFIGTLDRVSEMRAVLKKESVKNLPFVYTIDEGIDDENAVDEVFYHYADNMKNSQFCLILQGDTPTSRRLFDAMITGCVPIFTGPKYSMPFENMIPYDDFSIRIDEYEWLNHPESALLKINKLSPKEGSQLHNEMRKYVDYINWRVGSGVLEGILISMDLKRTNLTQSLKWVDLVGNWLLESGS